MNVREFRSAVAAAVEEWRLSYDMTDLPSGALQVYYENGPVPDLATLPYWLDVELRFYASEVTEVGKGGAGRTSGVIALSLYWKYGEGVAYVDDILDSIHRALRRRRLGPAAYTLHGERMTPPPDFYGWYKAGYMIPFVLDER